MENILSTTEKNKFSYNEIKEKSFINLINSDKEYDINVIVGFRGRQDFIPPLVQSFENAFLFYEKNSNIKKNFELTFVEHSEHPESKEILNWKKVSYIWTQGNVTDQYSRSFAYNFGVKYSNKAQYYILHDVDILVKENFFIEIYKNIQDHKCMQTYGKRRVLYLSKDLTNEVISGSVDINTLDENSPNVSLPMFNGQPALGSKGGSIMVEREFFAEVGGFDDQIMWGYSAEDQLFWDKCITLLGEVAYADNPPIDMFHMWHPPTSLTNPLLLQMENYMLEFRSMKKKDRMNFINLKKELFKDGE